MGGITLPTATTAGYTYLKTTQSWPDVACVCDATWWPVFVRFLRFKGKRVPDLWQGVGGNPDSAGTHIGGGVLDWSGVDPEICMLAREAGRPDTWPRPWDGPDANTLPDDNRHTHSIANGCPHLSDAAKRQLGEVKEGDDGLAADGPDPLRPPKTYRTWREGVAWMEAQMEDEMEATDQILLAQSVYTVMGKPAGSKVSVAGLLQYGAAGFFETRKYVRPQLAAQAKAIGEIKGQLAGQGEILKQVLASGSVTDLDAVLAATKEAARAGAAEGAATAINEIVDDADVTFTVAPPASG